MWHARTSSAIDLECGQTVNARSRQADVNLSYSHFVAGEKLLTRKDSGITDYDALPGKAVGVVRVTMAEELITQLRESTSLPSKGPAVALSLGYPL